LTEELRHLARRTQRLPRGSAGLRHHRRSRLPRRAGRTISAAPAERWKLQTRSGMVPGRPFQGSRRTLGKGPARHLHGHAQTSL